MRSASAFLIFSLNSSTFAGGLLTLSLLNGGMPSKSKTSIETFSGANSKAARIKALLYEPFLRLPAKARMLNFFSNRNHR